MSKNSADLNVDKKPFVGCFSVLAIIVYIISGLWFLLGIVMIIDKSSSPGLYFPDVIIWGLIFCLPPFFLSLVFWKITDTLKNSGTNRSGNKGRQASHSNTPDTAEQISDMFDKFSMASKLMKAYGEIERPSSEQTFQAAKGLYQIIRKKR